MVILMASDSFGLEGQSEWDQRQAFMQRLNNRVIMCGEYLEERDFKAWLRTLISLKMDLSAHFKNKEDKLSIDKKIDTAYSIIRSGIDEYSKIRLLSSIQETLHGVMRHRKFDVPIRESSPGSIIKNDRSY